MKIESINLSIETMELVAFLFFFIFIIKLIIKYWPKDDIKMKHITGSSIEYSKNYGLFQTIYHVIKWIFRWAKIDVLKLMIALDKNSYKNNCKKEDNIKKFN